MIKEQTLVDNIEEQLRENGIVTYRVDDGRIFLFTSVSLAQFLKTAEESGTGRVMVFIQDVKASA